MYPPAAMSSLLIFDFDGTATLSEVEALPFVAAYREDLAALCRWSQPAADARIDAMLAAMEADPRAWAFRLGGRAVAPATVDPYLRMGAIAEALLDELGALRDPDDRARVTGGLLYRKNYALTLLAPAFREDATAVFGALQGREVYVVTNSGTEHVQGKVRTLGQEWLVSRVRGDARKFVIEDSFDRVPAELHLDGLDRPVLLRRRPYFSVLDGLRSTLGVAWSDVWVVGDIFELDLALPWALGANVVLIANERTPTWERRFVEREAHVVESLTAAKALLPG